MNELRIEAEHVPSRLVPSSSNMRDHRIMSCLERPGASLGYAVVAILVLGLVAYTAMNVAY